MLPHLLMSDVVTRGKLRRKTEGYEESDKTNQLSRKYYLKPQKNRCIFDKSYLKGGGRC